MATKNDNKGVSNIIIPGENKDANLEMTPRTMNKSPVRTQHKDVALGEKKSPPRKTSFQNKNKTGQRCNSVMDVTSPPKQHESQLRVMESQQHIKIGGNQVQMQGSQEIEGGPPVESILDNPTELYALGKEIDKQYIYQSVEDDRGVKLKINEEITRNDSLQDQKIAEINRIYKSNGSTVSNKSGKREAVIKRQSKNSSKLSNESNIVGGVKNINRANLKNSNMMNKDLISNQNTGSYGQAITIKNVDPLYNQGSQEFDNLTQQKSFAKNINVDRSLQRVEISDSSPIKTGEYTSSQNNRNVRQNSQLSDYANKHIQIKQQKSQNISPVKQQLRTMQTQETKIEVRNPLQSLESNNMNSMQLDSKSNQNPSVVDLKSKGPFGAGKTNRSKNSKIQSSNEPLTAGTFNKASFSHHIGQDSTENLPVMIQSDEDSERYSEIEETDQQVEDEIEKVVPEEIADQVFEILQSKGFELYGWGNTSDYNQMIVKEGLQDQLSQIDEGKMVMVAGNTASIWPIIKKHQEKTKGQDPFDDYSLQSALDIRKIFDEHGLKVEIRLATETKPDRQISFTTLVQSLQHGDGPNCYYQDDIHLLFHEKVGTWHAWRFALIFEDIPIKTKKNPATNELAIIKQRIPQVQINQAKSLLSNLEFNTDSSHIWLQVRKTFTLGKEHQYPLDMLKHHYKTVPDKLFITMTEEGESRYSQEFLSESHKQVSQISHQMVKAPQMDEDSDDYSDDAYEEQTNQTKTDRDRATIDQDADIILNPSGGVNLQRSTEPDGSGNIFEKSARKSLNIESNQDGEASPVQDNDVQPQNRENYSIPVDDQPEEEEQQILQEQVPEDNATDDIQNMFSYENQTFDSRDRNSNMIGQGKLQYMVKSDDQSQFRYNNSQVEKSVRSPQHQKQTCPTIQAEAPSLFHHNFESARRIERKRKPAKRSLENKKSALKFQFINRKPKALQEQNFGVMTNAEMQLNSQNSQRNQTDRGSQSTKNNAYESFDQNNQTVNLKISITKEMQAQSPSIMQMSQNLPGPDLSKMRKFNNVVNTMRKNNIKYPFNHQKLKQDQSTFMQQNRQKIGLKKGQGMPSNYEMSSRSNSRCKSGPISVNPNRMFMKKGESMNKVGGNNVLLDDQQQLFNEEDVQRNIQTTLQQNAQAPLTSKNDEFNDQEHGGDLTKNAYSKSQANMNKQANSMNNLGKYKTVRNTGSNYMHRRKTSKPFQNNAMNAGQQVSVRQFLKSQFTRHKQPQTVPHEQIRHNSEQMSGQVRSQYLYTQQHSLRNRFNPKFNQPMNPSSGSRYIAPKFINGQNNIYDRSSSVGRAIGLVQDSIISDGPIVTENQEDVSNNNFGSYKQQNPVILYRQLLQQQYQPKVWGGSPNHRVKSHHSSRHGMSTSPFAGISKEDIIQKSAKEVVLKIKNNLHKNSQKPGTVLENHLNMGSLFESKVSQNNSKIEPPQPTSLQHYLNVVKKFEDSRQSYFVNMDRKSLKKYHEMQMMMNKMQMDQSYLQTSSQYVKTMDDQEELARLNMVNMKIEGTNYYQDQQDDSQINSRFKGGQMISRSVLSSSPNNQAALKIQSIYGGHQIKQAHLKIKRAQSNSLQQRQKIRIQSKMPQFVQVLDSGSPLFNDKEPYASRFKTRAQNAPLQNKKFVHKRINQDTQDFYTGPVGERRLQTAPVTNVMSPKGNGNPMIFGESKPLGEEDVTFVNPDGSALTDGQNLLKMINGKKVSTDLTYTLPDHEITLKFKKDILNKHFQSLGQSEMTPVEKIMSKMNLHTSTDGDSQQNFNTMGIAPVSSERQRATDIQVYENIQNKKPVTSQLSSRKKLVPKVQDFTTIQTNQNSNQTFDAYGIQQNEDQRKSQKQLVQKNFPHLNVKKSQPTNPK